MLGGGPFAVKKSGFWLYFQIPNKGCVALGICVKSPPLKTRFTASLF